MSTQHPDNVRPPFFADQPILQGEAEIREAYYAYSHLGCTEQMWDYEGKEVDSFVVKKLFARYGEFFRERVLGRDLFLTLRIPNPRVERAEAKVLLETLESIPRSYDAAGLFYGKDCPPPIFEVILPMTTSAAELNRIYHYYREFVGGKENQRCFDITVGQWVGDFRPDRINVIPLIEDKEHLLLADRIVEEFIKDKDLPYQRVFLARSDPALNYGLISAVLLAKVALARLSQLERHIGVKILPILGVGSAPFRGNFTPKNTWAILSEYPSVQTFTVQSAFKYDYPEEEVRNAIAFLNETVRAGAQEVDEDRCRKIIEKVSLRYAHCIKAIAPLVNRLARFVPTRRSRKLHIGLFGYSRELDGHKEVHLPRAIGFCCAMYSLGIPPEILGLGALDKEDLAYIRIVYQNFEQDLSSSLKYLNEDILKYLPREIKDEADAASKFHFVDPDQEHWEITGKILDAFRENREAEIEELIVRAASLRHFLG